MKKRYKIISAIVVVLVAARVYLPYGVKKYVNKTLDEIPGFYGSITDVDIHLYRGAYVIDSLQLFQENSSGQAPLFGAARIDLSVEWRALFKGSIVGEIALEDPVVNFIAAKDSVVQTGADVDWTKPIKDLIPLNINMVEISGGQIHFINEHISPKVDIYLNDLTAVTTNLRNVNRANDKLPSNLKVSGKSIGGGELNIKGDVNIIKQVPDVDLDMRFESVDLVALNDFLKAYARIDAEEGDFNLYSEMVINDSKMEGYVKPVINDLKIVKFEEDISNPLNFIWQSFTGLILEIFENQGKDQFATKVPLKGDLENPKTKVFTAVWNIFKNAFIQALSKDTDNTVSFENTEK